MNTSAKSAALVSMVGVLALMSLEVRASEESVDRSTQAAMSLDIHPKRGEAIFKQDCASCHGSRAEGDEGRAIPALAGQRFAYLVRQLADFSGGERDSAAMQRVTSGHEVRKPQSWVDLAGYLNRLPVGRGAATGDGLDLSLGSALFGEQCASCHQADAHGDKDGFVPSLRNQHYAYLARQMRRLADGHRHNVDEDLVRFIRSLDERDIHALADYLSRLQGPAADVKMMRDDGSVVD